MDLAIRATFLFCFVYLLTRIVGRRELSSLEPFDLILLIVIGDAIQQGLTQDDYSVTGALIVVGTFAILQVLISFISYRFPRLRPALDGEPIVIVQDGKAIEKNMKRERITVEEVLVEARYQQVSSLEEIAWAVLETSGKVSIIPKKSSQTPRPDAPPLRGRRRPAAQSCRRDRGGRGLVPAAGGRVDRERAALPRAARGRRARGHVRG